MKKLKKTGQLEMIGLVIIVFLLSVGMFFLVSISEEDNAEATSLNPQNVDLAQSMIDAIKYTKLDCPPPFGKKIGIDDLVRDMVTDKRIYCSGKSSGELTKTAISNILNATLGNWSKPYFFTIIMEQGYDEGKEYLSLSSYNCSTGPGKETEGKEGRQPLPLKGGAGIVTMKLFICK
jgi:hypothetical protein